MACFLVPAAEAVVTTVVAKTAKKEETPEKISMGRKFKWLSNLLWGGSALLCFEHVWHGEVPIPYGNVRSGGDHRHAAGDGFCRRHHGHLADGDLGRYVRGGRQSDEA